MTWRRVVVVAAVWMFAAVVVSVAVGTRIAEGQQ